MFFAIAAVSGFLSVALGAFAAHGLKAHLTEDSLNTFEVAVRYQFYHSLALFAVAWAVTKWPVSLTFWAGGFFIAGIVIFSGSLYLLSLTDTRCLGAVTPIGGLAFLAGWACLFIVALRG